MDTMLICSAWMSWSIFYGNVLCVSNKKILVNDKVLRAMKDLGLGYEVTLFLCRVRDSHIPKS